MPIRTALIPIRCFTSFNILHADNIPFNILFCLFSEFLSPNIIINDGSFSNKFTRHIYPEYSSIILQSNIKNFIDFQRTISTIHTYIYIHIFERRYVLLNNFEYFVCQRNQLENGTIVRNCTDADNSDISYFYQMCQRLFVIDLKIKFFTGWKKFSSTREKSFLPALTPLPPCNFSDIIRYVFAMRPPRKFLLRNEIVVKTLSNSLRYAPTKLHPRFIILFCSLRKCVALISCSTDTSDNIDT